VRTRDFKTAGSGSLGLPLNAASKICVICSREYQVHSFDIYNQENYPHAAAPRNQTAQAQLLDGRRILSSGRW
jgi:hypothetical protein